jgi:hypothetical protein
VVLIGFGVFNLSTAHFVIAQEAETREEVSNQQSDLGDIIIQRLLAEIGPIVGGIVAIGIQFARKQGLKISAEAEEYFVNMAKSFVENQSRFLYKQIRDNPQYKEYLVKGRIPPELGQKAKQNAVKQLKVELQSDEFTKAAKDVLSTNLETLVERYVTENKKETSDRIRMLLNDLVPIGVNAALLSYDTSQDAQKNKEKIIADALESIAKVFDAEELLFSHESAKLMIKSELNERVGNVK